MASLRKVKDLFDFEKLRKFKDSLMCANCESPPRPGEAIYHLCKCDKNDAIPNKYWSNIFRCESCRHCESCEIFLEIDGTLTTFVSTFKLYNCFYLKNGCGEELEAKSMEAHERICLSRDVTCPKLDCYEKFAFIGIEDHFFIRHDQILSYN